MAFHHQPHTYNIYLIDSLVSNFDSINFEFSKNIKFYPISLLHNINPLRALHRTQCSPHSHKTTSLKYIPALVIFIVNIPHTIHTYHICVHYTWILYVHTLHTYKYIKMPGYIFPDALSQKLYVIVKQLVWIPNYRTDIFFVHVCVYYVCVCLYEKGKLLYRYNKI